MNKIFRIIVLITMLPLLAHGADTVFQTDVLQFGKPTNANKTLYFKRNSATPPAVRWNESTSKLQFSNDGTSFDNFSSGNVVEMSTAITNAGMLSSVAANALTVAFKDSAGSDPSPGSAVNFAFRNESTTATQAQYTRTDLTAALAVTAPSGASLGLDSGATLDQYIWVWALLDGGVVDACLSGTKYFDDGSTASSTQISAGSTSKITLYCASSHTGAKPIRLYGRLKIHEATAGTYATAPQETSVLPMNNVGSWLRITATGLTNFIIPNRQHMRVFACGGGGGGGGGGGPTGNTTSGGGGGGGGGNPFELPMSTIPNDTLAVTVGDGGTGGLGGPTTGSPTATNGATGASTTITGIGISFTFHGGGGGGAGTLTAGTGSSGLNSEYASGAAGTASGCGGGGAGLYAGGPTGSGYGFGGGSCGTTGGHSVYAATGGSPGSGGVAAGGGGGSVLSTGGTGANGFSSGGVNAVAAAANSCNGGGGGGGHTTNASNTTSNGAKGGSGVAILYWE